MTYEDWIAVIEKIRMQYIEGAITAREYFNATVARACEVEQTPEDVFTDEVTNDLPNL